MPPHPASCTSFSKLYYMIANNKGKNFYLLEERSRKESKSAHGMQAN
jgi:hypothetical protein